MVYWVLSLFSKVKELRALLDGVEDDADNQAEPQEHDQPLVVDVVGLAPQLHPEPLDKVQFIDSGDHP